MRFLKQGDFAPTKTHTHLAAGVADIKGLGDGCKSSNGTQYSCNLFNGYPLHLMCECPDGSIYRCADTKCPTRISKYLPENGLYCQLSTFFSKRSDPCVPCPSGFYCDGQYAYNITQANDLQFDVTKKIMTGTVNMYQVGMVFIHICI